MADDETKMINSLLAWHGVVVTHCEPQGDCIFYRWLADRHIAPSAPLGYRWDYICQLGDTREYQAKAVGVWKSTDASPAIPAMSTVSLVCPWCDWHVNVAPETPYPACGACGSEAMERQEPKAPSIAETLGEDPFMLPKSKQTPKE